MSRNQTFPVYTVLSTICFNIVSSCRRLDLTARDIQGDQLPSNLFLLVQATNVNSVESSSIFDSTQLTYTHSHFAVCIRLSLLNDAGRTALNTRHGYHIETLSILVLCWHTEPFASARRPTRLLAPIARSGRQKCFYMECRAGDGFNFRFKR